MQSNENKWKNLRKRSRELSKTRDVDKLSDIDGVILKSFKPIKSTARTLFKSEGGGKELSKSDRDYKAVGYAVSQKIKGIECELSIDSVVRWFDAHYLWVTGKPCIDYNRWNALNTFRAVMSILNIHEQELAYLLSKWIFTYKELGYEEYLGEYFSLSVLKRAWILDALFNDTPVSKSKKSYY